MTAIAYPLWVMVGHQMFGVGGAMVALVVYGILWMFFGK